LHIGDESLLFHYVPDFDLSLADVSEGVCSRTQFAQQLSHGVFVVYFGCAYGEELWVEERHVAVFERASVEPQLELRWSGAEATHIERDRCIYSGLYIFSCLQDRLTVTLRENYEWNDDGPVPEWCFQLPPSDNEVVELALACGVLL